MNPSRARLALPFVLALAAFAPQTGHAAPGSTEKVSVESGDELALAVGETRTFSAKDVRNFSEGAAGIIDVRLTTDNSQFVINGRKPGSTTLLLIKNDGSQVTINIHVFARAPQVVEKELSQLLENTQGVRVRRIGAHIVIDGIVASEQELKRVQQVAALYPNQVESLVTLPGGGAVGMLDENKFIVRIDFYFVQYDRNSSYGVGFGWPGTIGGDKVIQSAFTFDFVAGSRAATASITNQPLPRLDIAARKGWAKVLKQATVVTNNGVEAAFANGGEQNFTVNTGLTIGVQRIPFGTNVTVLPRYNPTKREIDMRLDADVSDLVAAAGNSTLPGRTTSKLTTNITLKLGQSIVLSGIRTQTQTHSVTGLPLLSDIPILGLLFGSHQNQELETEGAVFVVPSVVQAVSTPASDMVDAAIARFGKFDGDMKEAKAYDKRPGAQPVMGQP